MVTRIGIVGFGWVARDYMWPAILAHPGAELRAVVSVRPEDFAGLPEEVACYDSVPTMLAGTPLDAVYVASPNHLHREHAVACLRAGLDVLCEKPLARDPGEAAAMCAAAGESNRKLVTAYDQRHHPAHVVMREWIAAGRLGTITQARIDYACWVPAGWSTDNWRVDPERAGGGAVIDLAPHGLDLLETLLDDEIEALHCFTQRAVHEYAVDDGGVLSARFACGAVAAITVGYNRPEVLPRRRLEITGTRGMLLAENTMGQVGGGSLRFLSAEAEAEAEVLTFADTGPFYGLLDAFLQHTTGGCAEPRDALSDQRLVRLLHRTTQTTQPWP